MYLLLDKDDVIVVIDSSITEEEFLFRMSDGEGVVKSNLFKLKVETVPDYVKKFKYKYDVVKGFYKNSDYIEPANNEDIVKLKEQQSIQDALNASLMLEVAKLKAGV